MEVPNELKFDHFVRVVCVGNRQAKGRCDEMRRCSFDRDPLNKPIEWANEKVCMTKCCCPSDIYHAACRFYFYVISVVIS
jgi:hypothetical protein